MKFKDMTVKIAMGFAMVCALTTTAPAGETTFDQTVSVRRIGNELIITGTDYDDTVYYGLSYDRNRIQISYQVSQGANPRDYARWVERLEFPIEGSVADGGIMKIRFFGGIGNDSFRPTPDGSRIDLQIDTKFFFHSEFPPCALYGDKGRDYLVGSSYDDIVVGGDGNDTLFGGYGSDLIFGGINRDDIHGGAGYDITCRDFADTDVPDAVEQFIGDGRTDCFASIAHVNEIYGDWDGNDVVDRGYFLQELHLFFIPNAPMGAFVDFGLTGDWAIAGDWDGDGYDTPGVFRGGVFYLDVGLPGWQGIDPKELGIPFGLPGDFPVVGDFDRKGRDRVGVYRHGQYHVDVDGDGFPAAPATPNRLEFPGVQFGGFAGDLPIIGDWNGDGIDDSGIYRTGNRATGSAFWVLDDPERGWQGAREQFEMFGLPLERPVVCDYNKDGRDDLVSVSKNGRWRVQLLGQ